MSSHMERHRAEMQRQALPAVEHFIAHHPGFSINPDQSGSQSNTNYVIFGQRGQESVVFKYYCEDERKEREVFALRHFAHTGPVPQLVAEEGARLIVQSRIPGSWLLEPNDPRYAAVDPQRVGYTLGQAVATLITVPLSPQAAHDYEGRFYDGLRLERYFRDILDASWLIHRNVAAYQGALFAESLQSIEANLPFIFSQPRLLYHQDALNVHFLDSAFSGFFDLEMCRVGTEAMQIGSLWRIFAIHGNWKAFVQGFEQQAGRTLAHRDFYVAQAFAHFLVWRYISRYGRWRAAADDPDSLAEASIDAPKYAELIALNNKIRPGD